MIVDITEEQYHRETGWRNERNPTLWITRSMILDFINYGPRFFYLRYILKEPLAQKYFSPQAKQSMLVGSVFETVYLQLDSNYCVWPEEHLTASGRRSEGMMAKRWEEEQLNQGLTPVDQKDFDRVDFMHQELLRHPLAVYLRDKCNGKGVVIRWTDEVTGLHLQVMLDGALSGHWTIDVKTGKDRVKDFDKKAHDYGYMLQDVMYTEATYLEWGSNGPGRNMFLFPYAQNCAPWDTDIIRFPEDVRDGWETKYRNALEGIARCRDTGAWGEEVSSPLFAHVHSYVAYELDAQPADARRE